MGSPRPEFSLDSLIAMLETQRGEAHRCPYLADREARVCGFVAETLDAELYHRLMDRGFRRSGTFFYRPACEGCRECVPMRVPVGEFRRSRNQERVWRKNGDLRVEVTTPVCTREKWELYARYLKHQHDGTMSDAFEDFERFLYQPCVSTVEFVYRLGRRLIGVSLADRSENSLSSVYCFFDPEHRARSVGTFSALWEIEYAREQGMDHYYLGYFVRACASMNYKARFRPNEVLRDYEHWTRPDGSGAA